MFSNKFKFMANTRVYIAVFVRFLFYEKVQMPLSFWQGLRMNSLALLAILEQRLRRTRTGNHWKMPGKTMFYIG